MISPEEILHELLQEEEVKENAQKNVKLESVENIKIKIVLRYMIPNQCRLRI